MKDRKQPTSLFSFGLMPFFIGGVTDSLNSCALTNLVLFLTLIWSFAPQERRMLVSELAFILGAWGTSFLTIMGFLEKFRMTGTFFLISRVFYLLLALVALMVAWFHMRDWLNFRKTNSVDSFRIKFPAFTTSSDQIVQPYDLTKKEILSLPGVFWGALAIGGVMGFLGSICPEQLYITAGLYALSVQGQPIAAIFSALFYSLSFILPLFFFLILSFLAVRSAKFRAAFKDSISTWKIICSAVFFAIGFGLIFTFL